MYAANINPHHRVREAAVALVPPSVCDAPDSEPAQHHKQREESDEEWEINDLEYFINFVKETLKNDLEQQRRFQSNEEDEVAFTDLHNLFRLHSESYVAGYFEGSIRAFQLMGACGRDVQRNKSESRRQPKQDELRSGFMLILSYWDFNGSGFCAVRRDVTITPFIGRLPIRNLQVFPMNYLLSEEIQLLQKRGRKFLQYAEMQAQGHGLHRYYVGLSLNHIQGSKEDVRVLYVPGPSNPQLGDTHT
jgi:hypothetical protein